jgi:membrane protein implicated in regulation of membrane protease activity
MLLDLLIGFVLLLVVFCAAVVVLCVYTSLPLADRLNELFRRIGLAGPSPGTRAAGSRAVGVVAGRFETRHGEKGRGKVFAGGELWQATCSARLARELKEGDRVELVYGEDLAVRVLGRASGNEAPADGGPGAASGREDG